MLGFSPVAGQPLASTPSPVAAGSGSTGTVAYTNANDTSAASGTTTVNGTVANTNANDTSAASGTTTVTGTLARTNANDTSSANGTTTIKGTLAYTNANDSVSASGQAGAVTGTVAYTNANDTAVANGTATGGTVAAGKRKRHPVLVEIHGRIQEFETIAAAEAYIISLEPAEEKQIQAKAKRIAKAVVRTGNAFVPPVFEPVKVLQAAPEFKAAVNMRAALTQARLNEAVNQQIAKELQDRDDEENAVAVMLLM